jgi:hypothetical protein
LSTGILYFCSIFINKNMLVIMKNTIYLLGLFLSLGLFVTACGDTAGKGDAENAAKQEQVEGDDHAGHDHHGHDHSGHEHEGEGAAAEAHGDGPEYTSAYVCPMHCDGSGSDKAGTCPACGMDYVANADHVKDGHSHQE